MSFFGNDEASDERVQVEDDIRTRLHFSRRFRQLMGGVAIVSGFWLAASNKMDLSPAIVTSEEQALRSDNESKGLNLNFYLPLGAIMTSGATVAVEKIKSQRRVERLINDYAGTESKAGFLRFTLVQNTSDDFEEVTEPQMGAIERDVTAGAGWVAGAITTSLSGLAAVSGAEFYETFVTDPQGYQNVL